MLYFQRYCTSIINRTIPQMQAPPKPPELFQKNRENGYSTRPISSKRVEPTKKVVIISGASAEVADKFIEKSVGRGHKVLALTSGKKEPLEGVDSSQVRYVKVSSSDYQSDKKMTKILQKELESMQPDEIHGIVLNGGAHPPKGVSMEQLNVVPLQTMTKSIKDLGKGCRKTGIVYLSSTLATYFPENDPYGSAKNRADQWLLHTSLHQTSLSLRAGLVLEDPRSTNSLASKHDYSFDQIARCPLRTPIVGSGHQICESVVLDDLVDAALNAIESEEELIDIINAVTHHNYTQMEFLAMYAAVLGREIDPIHIPAELVDAIGVHAPYGKVTSYAGKFFKLTDDPSSQPICHKRFESLLGKEPMDFRQIMSEMETRESIGVSRLPFIAHTKQMLKIMAQNPVARKEIALAILKYSPSVMRSLILRSHRPF